MNDFLQCSRGVQLVKIDFYTVGNFIALKKIFQQHGLIVEHLQSCFFMNICTSQWGKIVSKFTLEFLLFNYDFKLYFWTFTLKFIHCEKATKSKKKNIVFLFDITYRVSHFGMFLLNWLWQIEICKLDFVWRWIWNPEIVYF